MGGGKGYKEKERGKLARQSSDVGGVRQRRMSGLGEKDLCRILRIY
ncbi:MAG: hypothetical protein Q7S34_00880 [bacterium]|nr:hypothetical protein [bacterium]